MSPSAVRVAALSRPVSHRITAALPRRTYQIMRPSVAALSRPVSRLAALPRRAYQTRKEHIRFYDQELRIGGSDRIDASVARPASASRVRATLPLSTDAPLAREYEREGGGMRLGRVLEDLDALAGEVAYRHANLELPAPGADHAYRLVTARVERLAIDAAAWRSLTSRTDVHFDGRATSVGTSSMRVALDVAVGADKRPLLASNFLMVSRDAATDAPRPLPPLAGGAAPPAREAAADPRAPPTAEAAAKLHGIHLRREAAKAGAGDVVDMRATKLRTFEIGHPDARNVHGKVFGGYLLRECYEVAHTTATRFAGGRCLVPAVVEDFQFVAPVDVGTVVALLAKVVHSTATSVQVTVEATALDMDRSLKRTSGNEREEVTDRMHVVFVLDGDPLPHVVAPQSYAEGLLWLAGAARYDRAVRAGDVPPES